MGERRGKYRGWVGRPEERKYLNDLGVDGRTIIKWIVKKWGGEALIGLLWLRIGTGGRCLLMQ
jgi:hypothetical protein